MATAKLLLGVCYVLSFFVVAESKGCPKGWKEYGNSCYLFVIPTSYIRQMSWEDSRANCLGYGGDLVSILNSSEVNFIYKQTSGLGNYKFWIGLYRNKTTSDPKEGWIWSDGNNFTNPQRWLWREPNNFQNNENCAELFASSKGWNDNDCAKLFASICKRKRGLPDPTTPTSGTLPPTKDPPPTCDHGWVSYNRSCYRMFQNWRTWDGARRACRDTGGHLVRIDSDNEQRFLTNYVRPKRWNFWIGLNDLDAPGSWVWEFRPKVPLSFKNWQSGEPNGLGVEQCVEIYGYAQAGFWNDASCSGWKSYICEKDEGQNICPDGWIPYNDTCYQFNMDSSQTKTWSEAESACNSIGDFSSLVKINSQSEQDFINQRIQSVYLKDTWIGLSDVKTENVFRWSADGSELNEYQIWANTKPTENKDNIDCAMILSVRRDGAWSVQNCSQKQNYICMRNRDLPFCNVPLGMENGKISDSQITASSSRSSTNNQAKSRFRQIGFWCPAKDNKKEYLQVELPYLANVRKIVTEGNVTSYTLKFGKDGRKFNEYKPPGGSKELRPQKDQDYQYIETTDVVAKFIRIYPYSWNTYPCMRVEFIGCRAQIPTTTECRGKDWEKGPEELCYQINSVYKTWEDARSTCMDRGGDLLTITTAKEKTAIAERIKNTANDYYWISLSDRDYRNSYYWSNNDANGIISWGSGAPDISGYTNTKACVIMKRGGATWTDTDCSGRFAFICMKGEHSTRKHFARTGPTGVWMSSAKYYWPLSSVDNNMVLGTRYGKVNGKVTLTSGVKEKTGSALLFSGEGSYIDFGKFEKECIGNPDYCSGLSLSFMAWFDKAAVTSSVPVNIVDSVGDETKYKGYRVYIQNNNLYFVVSKTSKYLRTFVPIVENEWRHYLMRYNDPAGISVFVNGQDISGKGSTHGGLTNDNPTTNFSIGFQKILGVNSGRMKLAMVAFWDSMVSTNDISSIYKAEFGTCPFGWMEYGMSCYQINKNTQSNYRATYMCQSVGGDLINIDNNVEQAYISFKADLNQAWIGGHDKGKEGIFLGPNGKPIAYSNWNGGEPNNYWNVEDCVQMLKGGVWNDLPCYYYLPYICEKQKEVNVEPTNITTTVAPVSNITTSTVACHYTRITIGCPSGLFITINSALWGRREKSTCSYISLPSCGLKDIPTITNILKIKCDHYESCELHASETEFKIKDPCPTIYKYLEVNYTCSKAYIQKKCKVGWQTFKNSDGVYRCYRLFDTAMSWNDARRTCKIASAQGELLSIMGRFEQRFATSLMERAWYSSVWIGLNDLKTKGVYEWSDASSVSWTNWYVGQPDERKTDKSCVYMSLRRGKQGLMFWSDQNCTKKYPFICKYDIEKTTPKTTIAPTGVIGKCNGAGWVTSDKLDYCYYYMGHTNGQNWLNAQSTCRSQSARLVSVQSKDENDFVNKLSNNTMWLGLQGKGVFRGYIWSDGEPVRYTNWDFGQPDSYNGLDACVEMNPDTGMWSDRNCAEIKDVICKRRKSFVPVTTAPVIYPTPGSSECRKGWTLYNGMCYIVGNDTSDEYLFMQDAEKRCQTLGNNGHLASITSENELKFLVFLVRSHHSRQVWIGLNDLATEGYYEWTDGSTYNYANWNYREPNDFHRQENCVHMYYNGMWNDNHCQAKFSYVCKAYKESYKPPVKPTEGPRPENDGYCPKGWIAHAQYCYEFHTHPVEYRSWDDARDACERGHNSSAYGELVSIHDEFEAAFIIAQLNGAKSNLWIGMNNRHNSYYWVDNSIARYFNWKDGQPGWGWHRCVEIISNRQHAGRWNAAYCYHQNGYICKKGASKKPLTPTPTAKESICKIGYRSYDNSCFKFVNAARTFDDARKVCQKDGGDLIVVDSQYRQAYLIYMLERYIGNVWVGYHHESYSPFKFVDHSSAPYTYWGPGQPNRQLYQQSCTQANVTGSNFGVWDDVDCNTINAFVCEIYKGEPKITIPLNGSCPNGWKYYNKHCYRHFPSSQRWGMAQFTCAQNGANLVSIHDDREQDFLISLYPTGASWNRIWTGLNDQALERGYKWTDQSPLDYVNWRDGEPSDYSGGENCVGMEARSGKWDDIPCFYFYEFICKKKIECSSAIPLVSSMVSVTDTYNATSMGADKAILRDENDQNSIWCTNNTSGNAKIMIDLNELFHITGITVMGQSSSYVKSFRIDYERDENWRVYSPNRDSQTALRQYSSALSTKTLRFPFTADGLLITPLTWSGDLICMKIRLHGCAYVCQRRLFLDKPSRIIEGVINASSAIDAAHEPKQTGVEGHGWCAKESDKKPWIQFSFPNQKLLTTVRTFGNRKDSYVTKYSLQFSGDGNIWEDYKQNGIKRVFQGNNDPNSPMRHNLPNKVEAYYFRIIPLSWNKNICMRISLLGCEADCNQPILATDEGSRVKYSSSDKNSNPEYAPFNTGKAWCTGNSPLIEQYLEIKLGTQYRLSKIATLPRPIGYKKGGQITEFTMKYKKGRDWFVQGPKGQAKIFATINEKDMSQPKVNALTDYVRNKNGLKTKFIRIFPKTYNGTTVCIRVELYGCPAGAEIIPTTPSNEQKNVTVYVRFTSIEWNDKLNDKKSEEFAKTSKEIIQGVEDVYRVSKSFRRAEVLELRKGSVVAKIELIFNPAFFNIDNDTTLADAVKNGKVGPLEVDKDSFRIAGVETEASKGDSDSGLSGGAVAGVVITVLILVALAAGLAFFFYRRRRQKSLFAPQHFDNPISYSSKAYDQEE